MKSLTIEICMGSSCFSRGNAQTLVVLENFIAQQALEVELVLTGHHCLGNCSQGPNITIDGVPFTLVSPASVIQLLKTYLSEKHDVLTEVLPETTAQNPAGL